jgi:PadR family transcriptional regulator, regulatory protein PadR
VTRNRSASPQTLRVFGALLDNPDDWRHGYELSKQTGLPSGTLYPILIRLADRGLLDSRWEPPRQPGRPPRHAYRLTADGVRAARTALAAAEQAAQPRLRPLWEPS